MPATLNHGITYPGGAQAPNVPVDLQATAQSVEAALNIKDGELAEIAVDYSDGLIAGTTNSRYVRTRKGLKGSVTAHISVTMGSNSIPVNTTSNLLLVAGCVPSGFRPAYTVGNAPAVISGAGRGDNVQCQIVSGGDLTIRSAGAAFTSVSGSTLIFEVTYQWNGTL